MRILFALHAWHPEGKGGTEMHAHSVARSLSRKGHQVGVFTRTGRPYRPEYEITTEWEGPTSVTRINNNYRESPNFEWVYKNRRVHEAFERELGEFKPDLVHVHHLTGLSTTIVEAMKARGLPVVMTLHDFWTVCPRGQRMTRDLELCETVDRQKCAKCLGGLWPHIFPADANERLVVDLRGNLSPATLAEWDRHMAYILKLVDLLICPSAFHRERMLDFPLDPERIIALPHGLDHAPFDGRLRGPAPPVRIGFIGAVIPVKGVHVLIEAFKLLGRPDLSLEIYGEIAPFHDDRTYGDRLRDLARGLPNVHFHGAYEPDQVASVLDQIDILVVPSLWWETFCLTIREGLLAGIPVVASDLGAMREALDGERDGLLFRPGDAKDLKEKLLLLLGDESFRERFHNRGASVKSLDQYVEELEEVYAWATKVARRRSTRLVVAPPSFPSTVPAGVPAVGPLPWDQVGVAMRQHGAATVALSTRLPTQDRPKMGVSFQIRDRERDLGIVDVEIDLDAFAKASEKAQAAARAAGGAAEASPPPAKPPEKGRPAPRPAPSNPAPTTAGPRPASEERQPSGPAPRRLAARQRTSVPPRVPVKKVGVSGPGRTIRRPVSATTARTERWRPARSGRVEVRELRPDEGAGARRRPEEQ